MAVRPGGRGGQPARKQQANVGWPVVIVVILVVLGIIAFFYNKYGVSRIGGGRIVLKDVSPTEARHPDPWTVLGEKPPAKITPEVYFEAEKRAKEKAAKEGKNY